MENSELARMIDQDRWLLNNGLVSDAVKNQLFFCGSIVHKDVQAVEVRIKPEAKVVDYIIYVPSRLIKKIEQYNDLARATTLWDMWRFKRLLKKEGCLNFQQVLNSFVIDYCGPKWSAVAVVLNFDEYVDSIQDPDDSETRSSVTDQSADQG